jgi:hypothetical protein
MKTELLIITDDRTILSFQLLQYVDAASDNQAVSGINVLRRIRLKLGGSFVLWEKFCALNQLRRKILQATLAYFRDGQVLNLAGGFSAYRTTIC